MSGIRRVEPVDDKLNDKARPANLIAGADSRWLALANFQLSLSLSFHLAGEVLPIHSTYMSVRHESYWHHFLLTEECIFKASDKG